MPFEPATPENGCITAIPGSHKRGPVPHERVPDDYVINEANYNPTDVIAVPMEAGDGLFFHSLLLHGTAPNLTVQSRRAITMSYMAAEFRYTGEPPNAGLPAYLRARRTRRCVGCPCSVALPGLAVRVWIDSFEG